MEPLTKHMTFIEVLMLTKAGREALDPSFVARFDHVMRQFDLLQEELEKLEHPSNS